MRKDPLQPEPLPVPIAGVCGTFVVRVELPIEGGPAPPAGVVIRHLKGTGTDTKTAEVITPEKIALWDHSGEKPAALLLHLPPGPHRFQIGMEGESDDIAARWSKLSESVELPIISADAPKGGPPAVSLSASSLTLEWDEPNCRGAKIDGYDVLATPMFCTYRPLSELEEVQTSVDGSVAGATVHGLMPNTLYEVRHRAINAAGQSRWSEPAGPIATFTLPPEQPKPPEMTDPAARWMTITWPQSETYGVKVLHFIMQLKRLSDPETSVREFRTSERECLVEGLEPITSYEARVCAINALGSSPWSEWSQTLRTSSAAPDVPPLPPTLGGRDHNELTVRLVPPKEHGAGIRQFDLRVKRMKDSTVEIYESVEWRRAGTALVDAVIGGLSPNEWYRMEARAHNLHGPSPWSDISAPMQTLPREPGQPAPARHQLHAPGVVKLYWVHPSCTGGLPLEDWEVLIGPAAHHTPLVAEGERHTLEGNARAFVVRGLEPGRRYKARIRCTNSCGHSKWSESFDFIVPAATMPVPAAPRFIESTSTSLHITWLPLSCGTKECAGYRVWLAKSPEPAKAPKSELPILGTQDMGTPQSAREAVSRKYQMAGDGSPKYSDYTPKSARESRDRKSPTHEKQDEDVQLQLWPGTVHHLAQSPPLTVTGLEPGISYRVALSSVGRDGRESLISQYATMSTTASTPSAPMDVTVSRLSPDSKILEIRWRVPECNGSPIEGYVMKFADQPNQSFGKSLRTGGIPGNPDPTLRHATLRIGGRLRPIHIAAINVQGKGDWSRPAEPPPELSQRCLLPPLPPQVKEATPFAMLVLWNTSSFQDAGPDVSVCIVLQKMLTTTEPDTGAPARVKALASEGECWVKGLDAGTLYSLTLVASSDGVESKPSSPVMVATKAWLPGQVLSPPSLVSATSYRLQVKCPPAKANGAHVLRYHFCYSTDPEFEVNVGYSTTSVAPDPSGKGWSCTTLNGLTISTTYHCKVRAENGIGLGEWSEVGVISTISPRVPAQPSPPAIADATTQSLLLRWNAPDDFGDLITAYEVQVTNDLQSEDWDTKEATQTSLVWEDLEADKGYHARVRAINPHGASEWSAWSRKLFTEKDVPACPRNVSGNANDDGSTDLKWNTPTDNGEKITHFIVRAYYEARNPSDMHEPVEFTIPCSDEDAADGANINFHLPPSPTKTDDTCRLQVMVSAVNSLGMSTWAPWQKASRWSLRVLAEESVKTLRKSGKKNLPPARVACSVLASSRTSRKVNLSWPEPEDKLHHAKIENMELRWAGVPREELLSLDDWWGHAEKTLETATMVTLDENAIKYTLDNLPPGTTILAQVRTNCGQAGTGPWSALPDDVLDLEALTTEAEAPDQIHIIELEKAAPKALTITWPCPDPRGSSITQFQVEISETDDMEKVQTYPQEGAWSEKGEVVRHTVGGLKYSTNYWVAIASFNHMGKALRSEIHGPFSTVATAPGTAGRPILKSMLATSLHFEFSSPDPRGAAIEAFEIRYARDPRMKLEKKQIEIQPEAVPNSKMMSQLLPDLAVSQTYYVQLRAKNCMGWGAWTKRSQPMTTTVDAPARPEPPTLCEAKPDLLNLRWSEPEMNGSQVTQVRFLYTAEKHREKFLAIIDGESLPKAYDSLKASPEDGIAERVHPHCLSELFRLSGLRPGSAYLVAVRVFNAVGASAWSLPSEPIYTAIRPPGKCSMPSIHLPSFFTSSIELRMKEAPDEGGSSITRVYFRLIQDFTETKFEVSIHPSQGVAVISGLEPGENYAAWMAAENKAGIGEWSDPFEFTTPAMVPDTPGSARMSGPRLIARPFLPAPPPLKRSIFDQRGTPGTSSSASTRLPSTSKNHGSISGSSSPSRMKGGKHRKSKGSSRASSSQRMTEGQKDNRPATSTGVASARGGFPAMDQSPTNNGLHSTM